MKLIKNILMGFLFLSFSACSTDESEEFSSRKDIRFEQETGSLETRGTAVTGGKLTFADGSFGLFGYKLPLSGAPVYETGFFDGIEARVNSQGKIDYGETQYWPKTDNLRFLAYYPYTISGGSVSVTKSPSNKDAAVMTFDYTADPLASKHKDLMYAVSDPAREEVVKLTFEHALTRLTFQINKTAAFTEDVTIGQIAIKNINNKGTLKIPGTNPQWVESATAAGTNLYYAFYNSVPVLAADHVAGQYLTQKDNGGDSFMVMPMKTFADNSVLEITYYENGSLAAPYVIPLKNITADNGRHTWEMGKHINYRLTMDKTEELVEFSIDAVVQNWEDSDLEDIEIGSSAYTLKLSRSKLVIPSRGITSAQKEGAGSYFEITTNYSGKWMVKGINFPGFKDVVWHIRPKNGSWRVFDPTTEGLRGNASIFIECGENLSAGAPNTSSLQGTFNITAGRIQTNASIEQSSSIRLGALGGTLQNNGGYYQFTKDLYIREDDDFASTDQALYELKWAESSGSHSALVSDGKTNTYNLATSGSSIHPAAKACFDSNWTAVSGVNDPNYTWYLPAKNQLLSMWIGAESVLESDPLRYTGFFAGNYWSSTQKDNNNAYAIHLGSGVSAKELSKTNTYRIRCIRETDAEPASNKQQGVYKLSGGGVVLDVRGMNKEMSTDVVKYYEPYGGTYTANNATWLVDQVYSDQVNKQVYQRIQVAPGNLNSSSTPSVVTNGTGTALNWAVGFNRCRSLSHGGFTNWRLPTQRELQMIWMYRDAFNAFFGNGGFRTTLNYWSATDDSPTTAYYVSFQDAHAQGNGATVSELKTQTRYVRCVRDIPATEL